MNVKKQSFLNFPLGRRIILIILFLILFSFIVNGGSWRETGSDAVRSYVQDNGVSFIDENITTSFINSDKTSLVEPLVADLDNDGLNEIIIFRGSEIRLYTGTAYNYESAYTSSNISIRGNAEVTDWDDDGDLELIFVTNTVGGNHSLYVMTYNGTWNLEKNIENVTEGNGLNCHTLWGAVEKCCYVGIDGNFYCYDSTNEYDTVPVHTLDGDDCISGSIPIYIDYDGDSDLDVYFIYDVTCNELILLKNNNDGSFTNIYNITTTNGINQIQKADLDGGVKEIVITDSVYCNDGALLCSPYSFLRIHNIIDGSENCKATINYGNQRSPYLTGLHTCYAQEGALNCDYDGDSFNDIYLLELYIYTAGNKNPDLVVYDYECDELYRVSGFLNTTISEGTGDIKEASTTLYGKAVWSNFDFDNQYELWVWSRIINKDGSIASFLTNDTTPIYDLDIDSIYNHLVLADINGDSNNDLICQRNEDMINVSSFTYDNQKPVITQVAWDTGNPICNNTLVSYEISYTNLENDFTRVAYDCFDDGNISNGTLTDNSPAKFSCLYDVVGSYETQIYLQDTADLSDFSVYTTHAVTVTISEFCNLQGQQGGASDVSETGTTGGLDDWASKVPDALHDFGFKSVASKVFFGIFVIIALIMAANEKFKSAFVSIIIAILGTIALTYLRIFPIWLVFTIFIFASLLVYLAIFKFSSGNTE